MTRRKRAPVAMTFVVETAEAVLGYRRVAHHVTLPPSFADVPVEDFASLATDLGMRIRLSVEPEARLIPRNGTCLR